MVRSHHRQLNLCEHGVTGNTPPCHGGDFPGSNPGARLSVCIPIWQRSRAEIPFSVGSSPTIPTKQVSPHRELVDQGDLKSLASLIPSVSVQV